MRVLPRSFCAAVVSLLVLSAPAFAQGIAAGSGEVASTFGYAYVDGIGHNHFPFGGSGIYNFNSVVAAGFEYTYTSLGSETISGVKASEHLQTYGGVARFSFSDSDRIIPYVLAGFGGANLKAVASAENISESAGQNGFYFTGGGGATLFLGSNWGIRPEFRYERQQFHSTEIAGEDTASFGQNDIQGLVSIFYQFSARLPHKH